MAWVVRALAFTSPAWAVIVRILARTRADTARDRAMHVHECRILGALRLGPVIAIGVDIGAAGSAEAARCRAFLMHVRG